jgi:NADP-dependent 3-hydroxy acid dehydrogenase YdfG
MTTRSDALTSRGSGMADDEVLVITGGAGGMGLARAQALAGAARQMLGGS